MKNFRPIFWYTCDSLKGLVEKRANFKTANWNWCWLLRYHIIFCVVIWSTQGELQQASRCLIDRYRAKKVRVFWSPGSNSWHLQAICRYYLKPASHLQHSANKDKIGPRSEDSQTELEKQELAEALKKVYNNIYIVADTVPGNQRRHFQ